MQSSVNAVRVQAIPSVTGLSNVPTHTPVCGVSVMSHRKRAGHPVLQTGSQTALENGGRHPVRRRAVERVAVRITVALGITVAARINVDKRSIAIDAAFGLGVVGYVVTGVHRRARGPSRVVSAVPAGGSAASTAARLSAPCVTGLSTSCLPRLSPGSRGARAAPSTGNVGSPEGPPKRHEIAISATTSVARRSVVEGDMARSAEYPPGAEEPGPAGIVGLQPLATFERTENTGDRIDAGGCVIGDFVDDEMRARHSRRISGVLLRTPRQETVDLHLHAGSELPTQESKSVIEAQCPAEPIVVDVVGATRLLRHRRWVVHRIEESAKRTALVAQARRASQRVVPSIGTGRPLVVAIDVVRPTSVGRGADNRDARLLGAHDVVGAACGDFPRKIVVHEATTPAPSSTPLFSPVTTRNLNFASTSNLCGVCTVALRCHLSSDDKRRPNAGTAPCSRRRSSLSKIS